MQRDVIRDLPHPDTAGTAIGAVAGLYVAALLAPALLVPVASDLTTLLALAALLVLGAVLTVAVTVIVRPRGGLLPWLAASPLGWLLPLLGVLPLVAYAWQAFLFLAVTIAGLSANGATYFVGAVGFVLGFVATVLGTVLVAFARYRVADAAVDEADVRITITAGWSRAFRIQVLLPVLGLVGMGALVAQLLHWTGALLVLVLGVTVVSMLIGESAARTYRVTPAGLEDRRFWARRYRPWAAFDGLRVTDHDVVLARSSPGMDLRWSRSALEDREDEVLAALDPHLERIE